jgi:hypothetical protein
VGNSKGNLEALSTRDSARLPPRPLYNLTKKLTEKPVRPIGESGRREKYSQRESCSCAIKPQGVARGTVVANENVAGFHSLAFTFQRRFENVRESSGR